jgi:hypothetical protein
MTESPAEERERALVDRLLFLLVLLVVAANTCATAVNTRELAGPRKDESADHTPPPEAM